MMVVKTSDYQVNYKLQIDTKVTIKRQHHNKQLKNHIISLLLKKKKL